MFYSIFLRIQLLLKVIKIFLVTGKKSYRKNDKEIYIENIPISYIKSGDKKPDVVLLHGWAEKKEMWANIITILKHEYTIYALDLPGFGASIIPPETFKLDNYVNILNSFFKEMGIKKCILIGHSFGGKVAAKFATKYKDKVKKLVLYSVDLNFNHHPFLFFVPFLSFRPLRILLEIYFMLSRKSYKDFETLLKIYLNTHIKVDFKSDIENFTCDTLLLAGKYDFITPPDNAIQIKKLIPRANLVIFNKSTHLAHTEERINFTKTLDDFIRSV